MIDVVLILLCALALVLVFGDALLSLVAKVFGA